MMNLNNIDEATSIIEPFVTSVKNFGQNNALWVNKQYYTYRELYNSSLPLAEFLKQFDDERVMVFSKRSLVAYQAIIATLLAGKAYVPLNPSNPVARNKSIIEMADTQIIVADETVLDSLQEILQTLNSNDFEIVILNAENKPVWLVNHDKIHTYIANDLKPMDEFISISVDDAYEDACLLFTSGSTGIPKGVMLTHKNILTYVNHIIHKFKLNADDRVSQMTDLTFDFSVQDMFVSWAVGACVYAFPENYFIGLVNYLNENQITFMTTVPSTARLLNSIGKLKKNSLPYLRQNIFGGEQLSDSIATLWQDAAPNTKIENVCGPTEATVAYVSHSWSKNQILNRKPRNCIPVGKVFPEHKYIIVDNSLSPVEKGKIGELLLSGPQVISNYWRNEKLTCEKFVTLPDQNGELCRWYRTGDMMRWDNEDGLIFKGRVDDQIQIRGCRVEKLEIERILREATHSEFVAVVPWPIAEDGTVQSVIAYVSDTSESAMDIQKYCKKHLPDYMVPKEIHKLSSLPFNQNRKIDYLSLKNLRATNEKTKMVVEA